MSKLIEEWRPIEGYEGLYEVSDWGNVKSLNYNKTKKEKADSVSEREASRLDDIYAQAVKNLLVRGVLRCSQCF